MACSSQAPLQPTARPLVQGPVRPAQSLPLQPNALPLVQGPVCPQAHAAPGGLALRKAVWGKWAPEGHHPWFVATWGGLAFEGKGHEGGVWTGWGGGGGHWYGGWGVVGGQEQQGEVLQCKVGPRHGAPWGSACSAAARRGRCESELQAAKSGGTHEAMDQGMKVPVRERAASSQVRWATQGCETREKGFNIRASCKRPNQVPI